MTLSVPQLSSAVKVTVTFPLWMLPGYCLRALLNVNKYPFVLPLVFLYQPLSAAPAGGIVIDPPLPDMVHLNLSSVHPLGSTTTVKVLFSFQSIYGFWIVKVPVMVPGSFSESHVACGVIVSFMVLLETICVTYGIARVHDQ